MNQPTRLRTGIVGCGKVAEIHASALSRLRSSDLVAVCDADLQRAGSFAERFGGAPFSSVTEMCQQTGVQMLSICTPHPLHAAPVVEAAESGVHVLVEKPLASTLADCNLMLDAAERNGIHLSVISQRRWFEPVKRMKEAIDAGKIGRPALGVFMMFNWRDEAYYKADSWRGKWDTEGGGVLVNQSAHHLEMLQWLMGDIDEVFGYWANLNHPYVEVDDTAVAAIRFKSGGLGSIITSNSQKPGITARLHIHGTNGASVGVETDRGASFVAGASQIVEPPLNDLWTIPGEEHLLEEFREKDRKGFAEVDATKHFHGLQIEDFIDSILSGRQPAVSGEDGRKVVQLFQAIYESNREGRPVKFG